MSNKGVAAIGLITIVALSLGFMLFFNKYISPVMDASISLTNLLPYILFAGAIVVIMAVVNSGKSF